MLAGDFSGIGSESVLAKILGTDTDFRSCDLPHGKELRRYWEEEDVYFAEVHFH